MSGATTERLLYVTMTTVFSRIAWGSVKRRGATSYGRVWRNGNVRSASSATTTTGRTTQANVRDLYKRRNASGLYYTMRYDKNPLQVPSLFFFLPVFWLFIISNPRQPWNSHINPRLRLSPALPRHLSKDRFRRYSHHRPGPLHARETRPRDRRSPPAHHV